jgi:hypothetical protein
MKHRKGQQMRICHENTIEYSIAAMEADGINLVDSLAAGDTSSVLIPYVVEQLVAASVEVASVDQSEEPSDQVDHAEIDALDSMIANLERLRQGQEPSNYPSDAVIFEHALFTIKQRAVTLPLLEQAHIVDVVRRDISHHVIDAWMAACHNKIPRFYRNDAGDVFADTSSQAWSVSYFAIAKADPALRAILKDSSILDPYSGTGLSTYTMLAKGIARTAILSDIAYENGQPITQEKYYDPYLNAQMLEALYRGLPRQYMPELIKRTNVHSNDARSLPYSENSIDYVVTEPPYGVSCPQGDDDTFFESLPELIRVTIIPLAWQQRVVEAGYTPQALTNSKNAIRKQTIFTHIRASKT